MPREALIIACLAIGLLVSFTYPTALSSVFRAARLPSPLFTNLAVILSTLLLTQRQSWWLYLLAFYLVQVAFSALLSPYPLLFNVVSNLANVIEPLIGAYLFVRFVSQDRQFTRLRDVSIYVACVTVGALAGATWGATVRAVSGFPFWQSWQAWFLGDVLASLVLAPTIVLWVRTGVRGLRAASRWRVLEASLLGAALVLVGWWGLGADTNSSDIAPALLYLPVPLLVWAAVRFGPHGLVTALSLVTVMAHHRCGKRIRSIPRPSFHSQRLHLADLLTGRGPAAVPAGGAGAATTTHAGTLPGGSPEPAAWRRAALRARFASRACRWSGAGRPRPDQTGS